ncbi:MAG: hypothetical protein KJ042_12230, partial [Deltaproteobacteria bacterium]|nr:hypothetical protein [Deltaproteobacteria bacterium]
MSNDLIVFGAGALGTRIAALWRGRFPDSRIVTVTKTDRGHAELRDMGFAPVLAGDAVAPASFVVFCVPPSGNKGYADEARRALPCWTGEGAFVMTSSTAVYPDDDGGLFREDSPTVDTPRSHELLDAEAPVLAAGGCVVRLAGLYDAERGPHRVYARMAESDRRPDALINLIHYDDAASLCVAALGAGFPGRVFIGCDDAPITRADLVRALAA